MFIALTIASILLIGLIVYGWWNPAYDLHGAVRVVDGDSVTVDGKRYRLYGIDAPELFQDGGAAARAALDTLLAGKTLRARFQGKDVYGRSLITLYADKVDVCAAIVRKGYALGNAYSGTYVREEKTARRAKSGLWAKGGIACPQTFRANHS